MFYPNEYWKVAYWVHENTHWVHLLTNDVKIVVRYCDELCLYEVFHNDKVVAFATELMKAQYKADRYILKLLNIASFGPNDHYEESIENASARHIVTLGDGWNYVKTYDTRDQEMLFVNEKLKRYKAIPKALYDRYKINRQ